MYPFTNYYDALYRQNNKLIREVEKAINGEYNAIHCYTQLANLAPNEKEKSRILEIRKDELKHHKQFEQIYTKLTGRKPQQQKFGEECPNVYLEGLEFALQDEQTTVDFYMEVADGTADPTIKEAFRRAAADEQNHAVWFLYFYSKNK
ncbi:ferritin-like domain-containing protein [Bacillus sp. sid0103]|uniref:ferritin-like domain-containing protein n=1 Tax=Bacillus sp. sid0103 TaxID=2856337 RepID=UPI001C44094A|nr:ferritin-like domain-containing protein [Bacillus sp. sid0103]MBV7504111.1 ferritin-like domain-containing protein [Bacillus sp. sid0103]